MTTIKKLWCCYCINSYGEKSYYFSTLESYRNDSVKNLEKMMGKPWKHLKKVLGQSGAKVELVDITIEKHKK